MDDHRAAERDPAPSGRARTRPLHHRRSQRIQLWVDRESQVYPVTRKVVLGIQAGGNLPGVMTQADYEASGPAADAQRESDKRGFRI